MTARAAGTPTRLVRSNALFDGTLFRATTRIPATLLPACPVDWAMKPGARSGPLEPQRFVIAGLALRPCEIQRPRSQSRGCGWGFVPLGDEAETGLPCRPLRES